MSLGILNMLPQSLLHIATYRFTLLEASALPSLRDTLKEKLTSIGLKGSILLSEEGFNLSLAGSAESIRAAKAYFATHPLFAELEFRESLARNEPFKRMIVKIKPTIIAFDHNDTTPFQWAPTFYVQPKEFKRWYDEGRDMLVLDTRNNYEIQLGAFKNSVHLNIRKFTDFKQALNVLADEDRDRTIVTLCTGGVRCEKAAPYLQSLGFIRVYQLAGGIINYFKQCGNAYYEGECFVFDKRIAINENLEETPTTQCWDCRSPLTEKDQARPEGACPYCGSSVSYSESAIG